MFLHPVNEWSGELLVHSVLLSNQNQPGEEDKVMTIFILTRVHRMATTTSEHLAGIYMITFLTKF